MILQHGDIIINREGKFRAEVTDIKANDLHVRITSDHPGMSSWTEIWNLAHAYSGRTQGIYTFSRPKEQDDLD